MEFSQNLSLSKFELAATVVFARNCQEHISKSHYLAPNDTHGAQALNIQCNSRIFLQPFKLISSTITHTQSKKAKQMLLVMYLCTAQQWTMKGIYKIEQVLLTLGIV